MVSETQPTSALHVFFILPADDKSANIRFLFHFIQIVWATLDVMSHAALYNFCNLNLVYSLLYWNPPWVEFSNTPESSFCNGKTFVSSHRNGFIKIHSGETYFTLLFLLFITAHSWGDKNLACVRLHFQCDRVWRVLISASLCLTGVVKLLGGDSEERCQRGRPRHNPLSQSTRGTGCFAHHQSPAAR